MQNNNDMSVYKNYKKEIDHNAIFDKLKGLLKKIDILIDGFLDKLI